MRVWDVFLHVGDSILIAMAYNIMKMHHSEFEVLLVFYLIHSVAEDLLKAPLEVFMDIIQNRVAVNFGYSDDHVLESLRRCLERLQDDRMALPPQRKC
jgi:hypothetical protein